MKEVFTMWRHTNLIVLTALCAAVYAALLIPFQAIPIIPGLVTLRIANILPISLGLMFGPAGAWGAAIGNLIGDFFGTLGPGSVGGFISNFLTAFLAYKMWGAMNSAETDPDMTTGRQLFVFEVIALTKGLGGSLLLTFWVSLVLGLAPPQAIFLGVMLGTTLAMMIGGPIVQRVLFPRMRKWGLLWTDIMSPDEVSSGVMPGVGLALVLIGAFGGSAFLAYMIYFSGIPVSTPFVRFTPIIPLLMIVVGGSMLGGRKQVTATQLRHESSAVALT